MPIYRPGGQFFTKYYWRYSGIRSFTGGVGLTSNARIRGNPKSGWKTNPSFSYNLSSSGVITSVSVSNGGLYDTQKGTPSDELIIERNEEPRVYTVKVLISVDNTNWVEVGRKKITETEQDFDFNIDYIFRYVRLEIDDTEDSIGTTLSFQYAKLIQGTYSKSNVKLVDFLYNNEEKYVFILDNESISIYKNDQLIYVVGATGLLTQYFDELKWSYKDDTIIFTHKDMRTKILKRVSDNNWTWGDLDWVDIPYAAFEGETKTAKTVGITPSELEGAIKIEADSSIFDSSWVGQYIDGNGGRLKITEYVSGTKVNGYTVIPFYTTDKITNWTYISGYEPVWSAARGYPRTCLFAQQRLWFGGSKSKPSSVWASRLGDYYNFKNSGNYDNDSIDVDLLTNDVIADMVDNRGLHCLTSGQEMTAPEDSYTPNKIGFTTNTRNGSKTTIRPVVLSGTIGYIEKNGKSLLSYVYDDNQAAYRSDNVSLFTDLIQNPKTMAVETNSRKDRGDFLYVVLEDGTMLIGCVYLEQQIMSLSKFITDGLVKDVCSISGDTYIIVDRGQYLYLEKIEDINTDLTTQIPAYTEPKDIRHCWVEGENVYYTDSDTPAVGDYVYDNKNRRTEYTVVSYNAGANLIVISTSPTTACTRNEDGDVEMPNAISVLSDYNGKYVYLYDENQIYAEGVVNDGKLEIVDAPEKTCYIGQAFEYELVGNPIAINNKTTSIKKRITTADILCQNTPYLEFCGQVKSHKDKYKFFACTKYDNDVRYTIKGEFHPLELLSLQLNINYEG